MKITDYSMIDVGTDDEDCEIKNIRFGKKDLIGATIKSISKNEIVVQLSGYRAGDLIHITPDDITFSFSTLEGGKA